MTQEPQSLRTLDRALQVLEVLCDADGDLALGEISQAVGLNKSTVYRILQSLIRHRLTDQDPNTRKYRVGLKLFELAHRVTNKIELRAQALPELKELSRRTNETVHLAVLDDGDVVYIDKQETQRTIRMYSAIGKRGPAHCTGVGKVLLASLSDEELERTVARKGLRRFTERTITSLPDLKQHLAKVRAQGYAIDDAEHEPEIRCVACPIRDHAGRVIAAVSLTIPAMRVSRSEIEAMAPLVREYADRISRKMGWVDQAASDR
jgi:DNA-binding IclR family transcriptional regulator